MKKREIINIRGCDYEVAAEYRGFKIVRVATTKVSRRPYVAFGTTYHITGNSRIRNPEGTYNIGPTIKAIKLGLDHYASEGWL